MMDLYIDESNLYRRMHLYTKQFDWEKMWAIADDITDEEAIRTKAQDILDTFDIGAEEVLKKSGRWRNTLSLSSSGLSVKNLVWLLLIMTDLQQVKGWCT